MFASNIDFLCMKMKPFCLFKTGRANNQVKQGDALVFARYPVGVTYDQLAAMLTRMIHNCLSLANKMPYRDCFCCQYSTGNSVALTDSKSFCPTLVDLVVNQ
jgi:hypothetical protein